MGWRYPGRNRVVVANGIYHITQRAPGREIVFIENNDYLYFIHLLKYYSLKFRLKVYSFCLLPNHLHILLRISEPNLSVAMKSILENYATHFNSKYMRKGHVFCGRYRRALCDNDVYLLAISVYIHLNPFKAGLCKNIWGYKWSSLKLFLMKEHICSFIDYRYILNLLNKNIDSAKAIYEKMLISSINFRYGNILEDKYAVCNFKADIVKHSDLLKYIVTNNKSSDIFNIAKAVDDFRRNKFVRSPQVKIARKYLIEQLRSRGYSLSHIAEILGMSRQGVYYLLDNCL
ncbi:transposase [Candidatus Omnitrophota bacterium]